MVERPKYTLLFMTLPLFIRADAGGELGTGHVMRMLALAQGWEANGGWRMADGEEGVQESGGRRQEACVRGQESVVRGQGDNRRGKRPSL